jgi:Fe-S-cluster-containing hydrogenase component 2
MSKVRKQTRREFLRDLAVVTGGATLGTSLLATKEAETAAMTEVPLSGVVRHNPDLCRGCKLCELACSASHDGQCSPDLSRIHINNQDLELEFTALVCAQCVSPSCYFACPEKDKALSIDPTTGARYVNQAGCIGCGSCVKACPLPQAPVWLHPVNGSQKSFKCDLCKDRKEGPLCVEVCPRRALTFEERRA